VTRIIALIGIVTISFSAIFVGLADVAPATAGLFRATYALPVLFLANRISGDQRSRRLRMLAFVSGLLLAGDVALWHTSIRLVGAGLSTVVANTQVLWVGLTAWIMFGERPTRTAFVVVPIVLVGVALIGGVGSSNAYGDNPALGAGLALIASFFYASFLLLFRAANVEKGQTAGPLLDVSIGITVAFLAGGWLDPGFSLVPEWPAHGWLIALSLLVHTGGWLLIAAALPRLPALETSVMLLLQPAGTILWAGIIFNERLARNQWIGVGLVLIGILTAAILGTVRRAAVDTPTDP
jgi:drug/metabolite transporter (DMT)-like permease